MSSGSFSKLSYLQSAAITEDRKELPAAKERRRTSNGRGMKGSKFTVTLFECCWDLFSLRSLGVLKTDPWNKFEDLWSRTYVLTGEDVEWTAGASTGGTTSRDQTWVHDFHGEKSWSYTGHFRFQGPGLHHWASTQVSQTWAASCQAQPTVRMKLYEEVGDRTCRLDPWP